MTSTFSPKLTVAVSKLINQYPFFAVLMLRLLNLQETTAVSTAATDHKNIYINPDFFETLSDDEAVFVLAHEVGHFMMDHIPRMTLYKARGFGPDLKPYVHKKFNQAGDYVINDILINAGVGSMPSIGLHNSNLATENDLVDDVYLRLPDPEDEGGGGNGHGGFDEHLDKAQDAPTPEEVIQGIADAAAAAKSMGNMPGSLQRIVDGILNPKVDWKTLLRDQMTATMGNDSKSMRRVHRRRLAVYNIVWPGSVGFLTGGLVVGIDTSGSVSNDEMRQFLGEVQAIVEDTKPQWLKLMWVDSRVHDTIDISSPEELLDHKPQGGGGTDMGAVFETIDEENLEPETCVILTDGHTPWGDPQPYRVIWGITGEGIEAPHGVSIHVEVGA